MALLLIALTFELGENCNVQLTVVLIRVLVLETSLIDSVRDGTDKRSPPVLLVGFKV